MLCSLCSGPDHFRLECPENPDNKGKGAHVLDEDHDDWDDWKGDWSVPTTSWITITEEPNEDEESEVEQESSQVMHFLHIPHNSHHHQVHKGLLTLE